MKCIENTFLFTLVFLANQIYAQVGRVGIDQNNNPADSAEMVELMPLFPGCEEITIYEERKTCAEGRMLQFLYQNLKYPPEARDNGIEGIVVIRYIIDKDGTILEPEVIRDIGGGTGQEGLRVVKLMPKWNPGMQEGKAVMVYFNLPIKFKLGGPKLNSRKNRKRKRKN